MYNKKLKILRPIYLALVFSMLWTTKIAAFSIKDSLNVFIHHPLQLNYVGINTGVSKKIYKNLELGLGVYTFFYYRDDFRKSSNTTGLIVWARYYYNNFFVGASFYNGRSPYLRQLNQEKIYIMQYDLIANAGYRQKFSKKYYLDFWAGYNVVQKPHSFNPTAFSLWAGVGKHIGRR
ncbi:MAG: hypothetical protein SGJ10_12090 [Bacteroidota bacterium]|nr:hypothetical protein [Bacteroidota bacterium]